MPDTAPPQTAPVQTPTDAQPVPAHSAKLSQSLTIAALGVVYGDIGTSPLYAIKQCFSGAASVTAPRVYGVLSLIVWALTIVVTVKYVIVLMRADNRGEGGIFALTVSVMSAVEGLEVKEPELQPYVLPLTLILLVALFAAQRRGTERVGGLFGPVMIVWFTMLGMLGIAEIARHPAILRALNPFYGIELIWADPATGFVLLGSVVLAVTGAEALYADMGHFGPAPIR